MAITFLQQPTAGSIQSSDNPIMYVFQSDQFAQANFSFEIEVSYAGAPVSKHIVYVERAGGIAQFDAMAKILPLVPVQQRTSTPFNAEELSLLSISVSERYGATPSLQTTAFSASAKIMKAATDNETFKEGWIADKYTPTVKWLTNTPNNTLHLNVANRFWLSILNSDEFCIVQVDYYDASGGVIAGFTSATFQDKDKVTVMLSAGIMQFQLGAIPLSSVAKVGISLNQSDVFTVIFDRQLCGEGVQLSWVNNIGGFDQFLFTHNAEREFSIETKQFDRQFGSWAQPNAFRPYAFDASTSGTTHYVKEIQPSGSIYSGWIPQTYQNWLNELYWSVDVVAIDGTKRERIPVTDTKSTIDKSRFEDALSFEVNYKKSSFKSINT